jgi:hypothetical protein
MMKSSDLPKMPIPRNAWNVCFDAHVSMNDALDESSGIEVQSEVINKIACPVLGIMRRICASTPSS